MRIQRSQVIKVAIVVIIVGWLSLWIRGFWLEAVFRTAKQNAPLRAAMFQIHDAVHIGASYEDVLTAYWSHRVGRLQLKVGHPTEWQVEMPLEFIGDNCRLLFNFQNGKVTGVRILDTDGKKPVDAPKHKQGNI